MKVTNERLKEIIDTAFIRVDYAEAMSIANELLAVRAAQEKPALHVKFRGGWPIEETLGLLAGEPLMPDGFHAFYAAPPAQPVALPDGWVKCSDRMPEIGQEVLIRIPVCEHFNIENGTYKGNGKFSGAWCSTRGEGCAYRVTEWMPLPAVPEDKS